MESPRSPFSQDLLARSSDFSLVLGGPLYQLYRRTHLSGSTLELVRQRMIAIALLAWLPLLLLSTLQGRLLGGDVAVPFLADVEVHVRLLLAVPLLIVAELVVHKRFRFVVRQFLERKLIPASASNEFEAALASAVRLRNSVVAELLMIGFVYVVGISLIWRPHFVLAAPTWSAAPTDEGTSLTLSGIWYAYVSLPLFQFLLLRWYFRIFIWTRFLWRVSRIDLQLVPTHPDRLGGLGFLSHTAYAFVPVAAAHGAMLAGMIANRIFHTGAKLTDFKAELVVVVLFLMCLAFGPLVVFASRLGESRRTGLREYGTLAGRYVGAFDAKWLRGGAPPDAELLGSGDIQSLADLSNSFEVVRTMRRVPVTQRDVFLLAIATLAPVLPLALTMMSMEDLMKRLLGVLL